MRLIDFDKFHRLIGHGYRGNSRRKLAYFYYGKIWMVKTSNVLNEYIGSQIYKLLRIPVHETILGKCQGQIVVACCDFTDMGTLLEYGQIKNTMDELLRFIRTIDMNKIERMIENIPEQAYDLPIITPTQKQFYIELLNETFHKIMRY